MAGCARPPACYQASSDGRGWKRVALPRAAPHLAAPPDIDQFRAGEPAVIWGDWRRSPAWAGGLGSTEYRIPVYGLDDLLEVEFGARLGGAAVEVIGERGEERYTLFSRARIHEDSLRLEPQRGTDAVTVIVHHHLRAAPEVSSRSGWQDHIDAREFTARDSLYYFDPGGRGLELCEAPARQIGVRFSQLEGKPQSAALKPTPLTRLLY